MEMKDKMQKMMEVVEKHTDEEGRVCVHKLLNDGHHDEYTATTMVHNMKPVAWIGTDKKPSGMEEYLSILGITPMFASDMVHGAYDKARKKGAEKGIDAPKLEANEWDCYLALAMCIADYWVTHWGDLDVASMLAYQYLSDPDK